MFNQARFVDAIFSRCFTMFHDVQRCFTIASSDRLNMFLVHLCYDGSYVVLRLVRVHRAMTIIPIPVIKAVC